MTNVIPLPLPAASSALFTWTTRDVMVASGITMALDIAASIAPGGATPLLMHSELVRDSALAMQRAGLPSLMHAWRFCQAAKLLKDYDDTAVIAQAQSIGCRIAAATVPGWSPIDVVFAEFGSLASYIAISRTAAVEERGGVLLRYMEIREGQASFANRRAQ